MIRIKSLQKRQRIFDDLEEIANDPNFLDRVNHGRSSDKQLTTEQYTVFCTIAGVSSQIDGHLDIKSSYGRIFWFDVDGVLHDMAVDFDFI